MKGAAETALIVLLVALVGAAVLRRQRPTGEELEDAAFPDRVKSEPLVVPEADDIAWRSVVDGLPTVGHWRGKPALADFDADGDLDLAASIRRLEGSTPGEGLFVWLQEEDGPWSYGLDGLRRDMGYGGAAAGDFDEDGKLDLAFSGHDVPPHVFFGDGRGGWPRSVMLDAKMTADLAVADFAQDGHLDVATLAFVARQAGLMVFAGDGTGAFPRHVEVLDEHHFGARLHAEDVDGDGVPELLAATSVGPRVWSFDSELVPTDRSRGLPIPEVGGTDLSIVPHDLDGDGTAELVLAGMMYEAHPPLSAFRLEDGTWIEMDAGLPDDEAVFDLAFLSLDEDTTVLAAAAKFGISILAMPEPGRFERAGRLLETEGVLHLCAGDVTGDGRDELVTVGFGGVTVRAIDLRGGSE